jgi:hypothetical protein
LVGFGVGEGEPFGFPPVGVGDGVGLEVTVGVGLGLGGCGQTSVGTSWRSILFVRPEHQGAASSPLTGSIRTSTRSLRGGRKSVTGRPARAEVIKFLQI